MSVLLKQHQSIAPSGLTILRDLVAHGTERLMESAQSSHAKAARHETCIMHVVSMPADMLEQIHEQA